MASVSIQNFTRHRVPRFAYEDIAESRLRGWDISLVFAGRTRAQSLNRSLREKNYVPNVLSYVVGKKSGEIIICPDVAKRQAPKFGLDESHFILYLFIHGILHLEGRAHGVTMEKWEQRIFATYAKREASKLINDTTHRNRHRHRNAPGQTGRTRRVPR